MSSTNQKFAVRSCVGYRHTVSKWHVQGTPEPFSVNHDSLERLTTIPFPAYLDDPSTVLG